jgi:hypothetical protein
VKSETTEAIGMAEKEFLAAFFSAGGVALAYWIGTKIFPGQDGLVGLIVFGTTFLIGYLGMTSGGKR